MRKMFFVILMALMTSLAFGAVNEPKECEKSYSVIARGNDGQMQALIAICEFEIPEKNLYCVAQLGVGSGGISCVVLDKTESK